MLQQFSWGHFLIAMILLNLLWYVFVGLVCYRSEVLAFLGRNAKQFHSGGSQAGGEVRQKSKALDPNEEKIGREVDDALMGRSRLPDGVQVKTSGEVGFAASDSEGRYDQLGLVADVVQELKLLFSELEKGAGDKRDFFRLLGKLKQDYGPLGGHPSVGALTGFVVDHASFHLTAEEIDNLWY